MGTVSPRYRRAYNRAPLPLRITLIILADLWAALTLGTRYQQ